MISAKKTKPKRLVKVGTTSTRKHRFESFNQRIAKLDIDPLRRRRRNEEEELGVLGSCFRTSLDRWKDLNLSENFTSFIKEVDPICNSLPQVLHHNERIFDILVSFIEKRDSLSLEPLLDLLSNFAHDLGVRFENYFSKAVTLLASLAAGHKDVEVIEWTFTCLAWLFKYLSRLLVQDLRPVLAIMAPLLGKQPQKLHTTRFAAEAMSFLVRKAAKIYAKDSKPLNRIIDAIREDILSIAGLDTSTARLQSYQNGLMTLLFDSIKGIGRGLFSGGLHIYHRIIECLLIHDDDNRTDFEGVVLGVTVALVHHTNAETFRPILSIVLDQVEALHTGASSNVAGRCGRLLFTISTVRKGTRIHDWTPVLEAMLKLLQFTDQSIHMAITEIYKAAAVILQSSPLDLVIPRFRLAMNTVASDRMAAYFLPFCSYFGELDRQRFLDLLFPYFSKFLISKWQENELALCLIMPKLIHTDSSQRLVCPAAWEEHIVRIFGKLVDGEQEVIRCNSYIELLDYVSLSHASETKIMECLTKLLDLESRTPLCMNPRSHFAFGNGLKALARRSVNERLVSEWPLLCDQAHNYGSLIPFLEAVLSFVDINETQTSNLDVLVNVLIGNAHSTSHQLRKCSLQILDALYAKHYGKRAEVLVTALSIEDTPLEFQAARSLSMQVRKLASQYDAASSHKWLQKLVPHFCFGMLTYKLSQVWDDATIALQKICDTKIGEDIVSTMAFEWLEQLESSNANVNQTQTQREPLTKFQCSNLFEVEDIVQNGRKEVEVAVKHLQRKFDASHTSLTQGVDNPSALALRVLLAIPQVAEKRSRQLVPLFLSWSADEAESHESSTQELAKDSPHGKISVPRPRRRDQKVMVDIFASFHNPKVLYRSSDVFLALQGLLTNGNVEIQKSALKALFTWKHPGIQPYQENLLNLLDEARFRDELATFLQVDEQNSVIQQEHRPEVMPIILRLLYGKMIAGTDNSSTGQAVKRRAVLQTLSRLGNNYLQDFVHIALGPLSNVCLFDEDRPARELMSIRKQVGMVKMMKDMLEVLGDRLSPFSETLSNALVYCLVGAARTIESRKYETEQAPTKDLQLSLLKSVYHTGIQCIDLLSRYCPSSSFKPSMLSLVFGEILSPRLDRLPVETAQSISGILRLFSTWASSQGSVLYLGEHDTRTVKSIINCLCVHSAKDEVKLFVLGDIIKPIVEHSKPSSTEKLMTTGGYHADIVFRKVLQPNLDSILSAASALLRTSPSQELLGSCIELVSTLAPLVGGSSHVINLLELCAFLLDQPSHRVKPRSKGELLQIVQHFVPLVETRSASDLEDRIFNTASSLFGYFRDRENRVNLCRVLSVLAEKDPELQKVAQLCISLNAFSVKKVDEPDFGERLKAYNAINNAKFNEFNSKQWRPIVYNMLFYVKDDEELAIRSNASFALRRCVEMNPVDANNLDTESSNITKAIILPALRVGVSDSSELIRTEYMTIMAHLIRCNPNWEAISDMLVLLVNDDEEASFFSNILHIQQHRRLRALRRLALEASRGTLHSANVAHFFIPLIEHFVFDKADDDSAHNLSAETVVTVGALASSLEWPQFRAVFRRYSSYVQTKPEIEKTVIKLLGIMIDALSQAAEETESKSDRRENHAEIEGCPIPTKAKRNLATTMPRKEKLTEDLTNNLLPALEKYLHNKDESTVSMRVPVAFSIVKLLKLLPSHRFSERLPPVLTDVCHILRSRAQESRDLTRKTLVDISTLIGPGYFGFVLKELRSSLARGYQLHVLSYTVHSMLVATSSIFKPGDLDYCLSQIVAIVMDDIFGATGQEKDAEEYISKMKEVKSSKSYDSMELVARTATVEHFAQLIRPLQVLLEERLDQRIVKKIDELLRRIGVGLLRNEAIQNQKVLVFCYEIIREVYQKGKTSERTLKADYRTRRFLIDYKGASKSGSRGSTTSYDYKLACFALDVLRSVLHKYDSLQTPENLSGFAPIIGDAIVQLNEEVQISAFRLLTAIIKVPLRDFDDNAPIYVAECVKVVKASTSTNAELAQAAIKLVSAILRERRTVEIRETDLAYLVKRLKSDLEEPDKQGVAFNFLRAIMTRKIIIAEIYEILDAVAVIMITNQTKGVRDMARGAYFQFIMNYPQSRDRFGKQLGFLVRNLEYKHEEGRRSVMEAVHLLFLKVGEDLVQDMVGTFFVPLVMVMVNDDSGGCREMSGALLKKIFERADAERTQSFLKLLRTWLDRSAEPLLNRAALQMYGLCLDNNSVAAEKELRPLQSQVAKILKTNLKVPTEAEWELLYFALQTFAKICQVAPAIVFDRTSASLWASIRQCLSFPHAWVKLSASKLLGSYFADFARATAGNEDLSLPLKGSSGLWLNEQEIIEVTRSSLALLRVPGVREDLASQCVRNLLFLGKIMAQISMTWPQRKDTKVSETATIEKDSLSEDSQPEDSEEDPSDTFEGFDASPAKPALGHLISQISRLLRRGPSTTRAPSLTPLRSSLSLLGALITTVPLPTLTPHIPTLLLPLHNLTDPTIPQPASADPAFTVGYKTFATNAQELMGVLQGKMGTTEYISVLSEVREKVKERRESRKVKRRIEVVAEPEKAGQIKRRKGERKRERRKERSGEQRGLRRGW